MQAMRVCMYTCGATNRFRTHASIQTCFTARTQPLHTHTLQSRTKLQSLLQCEQLSSNNPAVLSFGSDGHPLKCTSILTRHMGKLLIEMVPCDDSEEGMWMSHGRVRTSINKLQLSISFRNLLDIAVQEVCMHV